jgi:DNA-binding XRE family transcriptional regulator
MKQYKRAGSTAVSILLGTYFLSIISGMDKNLEFLKYFSPLRRLGFLLYTFLWGDFPEMGLAVFFRTYLHRLLRYRDWRFIRLLGVSLRAKLDALNDEAQELKALADARLVLGIDTDDKAHAEIAKVNKAFNDLKASGTLTQEELARASDLHRKKINELEKSLKSTKVPLSEMVGEIGNLVGDFNAKKKRGKTRYRLIIPLVFYHGERAWNIPKNFAELFDVDSVPVVTGESECPIFFVGIVKIIVSPGSNLPLLFPAASSIVNVVTCNSGACKVTLNVEFQIVSFTSLTSKLKVTCSWSGIESTT